MKKLFSYLFCSLLIAFMAHGQSGQEMTLSGTATGSPDVWSEPYSVAMRTNILYDAILIPTLGVEWRIDGNYGIKLDASFSFWGKESGNIQKIFVVSPEFRWYLRADKRLYTGIGCNIGSANVRNYMMGALVLTDDLCYKGNVFGIGAIVGYQLPLTKELAIDFNIGLGYVGFKYDTFTIVNDARVPGSKDQSKSIIGPSQAGISLIWRID